MGRDDSDLKEERKYEVPEFTFKKKETMKLLQLISNATSVTTT